MLSSIAWVCRR